MSRRLAVAATLAITGFMILVSFLAWQDLPAGAVIPVHWADNLTPDRFVDKGYGLVFMPLVSLFTFGLLTMVGSVESELLDAINFRQAAHWASVAAAAGFASAHGYALLQALGRGSAGHVVLAGAGLVALGAVVASTRHQLVAWLQAAARRRRGFLADHSHLLVGGLLVLAGVGVFLAAFLGSFDLDRQRLGLLLGGGVALVAVHTYLLVRKARRQGRC